MKLTLQNIKRLRNGASELEKYVLDYIGGEWRETERYYAQFPDEKPNFTHIFTDVLDHGCSSGTVGSLIYYSDTTPFYEKYKDEIGRILYDSGVYNLSVLDGWDNEDPLALEDNNKCILAWFGFEATMEDIAQNFEELGRCY